MASTAIQGAALGYVCSGNTLNAPRPLGFVERAAGVANGLDTLQTKLESLLGRIDGNGESQAAAKGTIPVPGLGSQISDAEGRLRTCLSLVDELHARF
jgi:hypothetical protein